MVRHLQTSWGREDSAGKMGDASVKVEPYFRAYRKKYFRVIINLEELMGMRNSQIRDIC